jgi:tetratricopeptide (TPR) repeat protein
MKYLVVLVLLLAVAPVSASDVVTGPALSNRSIAAAVAKAGFATGSAAGAQRVITLTAKGDTVIVSVADTEAHLQLGTKAIKTKDLAKNLARTVDAITTDKAKAVFAEANQHYSLGEFDQAMASYSLAYRLQPLPAFLFNIAQCHRKLGHYKDAIAMYQNYLVGVPDAPHRDVVESLIAEARERQAEEDQRAAAQAKLAADLEAKRIEAEKKKVEDERKAKEAERKAKEAEARAAEQRREAEALRIKHEKETYDRHPARAWMIATGVVGAAGLGVGGYFAVQERDLQHSFDAAKCGDPTQLLPADQLATCRQQRDDGQRDATLATSFLIGGGAVVAAAAIVFAIDPGNVERPRTQVSVTPHSVGLVVHW